MTQQSLTEIRQAVATYLAGAITGLEAVTVNFGQITPPCAVVLPAQGSFARYQVTFDGQVDYTLRVVVLVPASDSATGQDTLDPYLGVTGSSSIWAALRADPTCAGGVIGYAVATEATGYGLMNIAGVDYLAASVIVEIGD